MQCYVYLHKSTEEKKSLLTGVAVGLSIRILQQHVKHFLFAMFAILVYSASSSMHVNSM